MVTVADKRDAEIFGKIAELLAGVSVKNKKNLNDILATCSFTRSCPDEMEQIFKTASRYAAGGRKDKEWY
jgi:hypothetical protein